MSGLESLYPFLYPGSVDAGSGERVLAEVTTSTREKVAEIEAVRSRVAAEHAEGIARCARDVAASFAAGGRLVAFGNGGSSTDAQAVAACFTAPGAPGPALPAVALTADVAVLTALSNDVSFEVVFARPIAATGRPGDVAVALSTSGGSRNVLAGLAAARRVGMTTVGLAGGDGGAMAEPGTVDHLFVMPSSSVHRIQEAQTTVYQVLAELVRGALRAREH
ncbi:SIS domain-containing protein [Actinomycetospora sp. TBRC 11914]|uniref:D-sedoheptulose-7-phosphate isomerase n=1 Tax=Actinomycetospora sp. TBRC 11914 TaxID=2729387 RepID=UPI00145F001D|nr:SIS domain-containing protein [Actinomycetospora sp. TBRC 11914]NMO91325.1 SIS domain-containing protein [Actinomycetospora sp. TBRC 11914]